MSLARTTLTGLVLAHALCGQDLLWRVQGQTDNLRRGFGLRAIGDVNGDGWEDLAEIIARRISPGMWCCFESRVAITSGRDGSILSMAPPFITGEGHGQYSLTRTGDMDGDGTPDYAYLSLNQGHIVVASGRTHTVLWSHQFPSLTSNYGQFMAGNLDLNGDGRNDLVTCALSATSSGVVYAYDNSGTLLYQIINTNPNYVFGTDVAALGGDLDGDGCDEFLVVGPDPTLRGVVHVVSGRTGTILHSSYGELPGDYLYHVIGCGDLDGDGMRDFAGSSLDLGNHCVTTFSGRTGQRIRSYRNPSVWIGGARMGSYLAVADMDHDGVDDILAFSLGSFLFALNGRTGDEMFLFAWDGYSMWPIVINTCMMSSAILAPPPGEHYPVVVYGEYCWRNSTPGFAIEPGLISAYRTSPPTATTFGRPLGTGGMSARMGMRELAGVAARFTLSKAQSGTMAFLVLGTSNQAMGTTPLPLPLGPLGFPGMLLQASTDAVLFAPTGTSGIANGYAQIDVQLDLTPTASPSSRSGSGSIPRTPRCTGRPWGMRSGRGSRSRPFTVFRPQGSALLRR